ncbi:hypothetical protein QCA50_009837 [Cerrena zonata]|uniref:Uncharacterized protein n=1 Tax=Cerrena zonata TaxID=2478898 RepID=A0AAW0GCJ0_9APHY
MFTSLDIDLVAQDGLSIGAEADPLVPLSISFHDVSYANLLTELNSQIDRYHSAHQRVSRMAVREIPQPYIAEFGFAEPFSLPELYQITWDERRANYLLDYLNQALLAINGQF